MTTALTTEERKKAARDAIATWEELVRLQVRRGMTKAEAVRAIVVENPTMHRLYVEAHNRLHGDATC